MKYNNLSGYFREKYGRRLKKICIDGGFSCPNRDGTAGYGGCIFCSERGSGDHIRQCADIPSQVNEVLSRGGDDELYIAYFQNFTNTYAPLDVLRERYSSALCDPRIAALAIGTRPDCITDEIAELIASYSAEREVWVELGLQTASDKTAELINRGYSSSCFSEAVKILNRHNIPVVVHLMLGLPSEDFSDIKTTADFVSKHKIWGVKLHSVYIMSGTALGEMYLRGEYTPPSMEQYTDYAAYVLGRLPRGIIVHRLTGDCPKERLLAPLWSSDKHAVIAMINQKLEELK